MPGALLKIEARSLSIAVIPAADLDTLVATLIRPTARMAKKARAGGGEPTAATPVPTRESLQRISYLVQASVLLQSVVPALPTAEMPRRSKKRCAEGARDPKLPQAEQGPAPDEANGNLVRPKGDETYGAEAPIRRTAHHWSKRARPEKALQPVSKLLASEISSVGKKATVRIDPSLKRVVCQACHTALVPGLTSSVRVKPSKTHVHMLVYTCNACRSQRRIPATPLLADETAKSQSSADADSHATVQSARRMTKRERRERKQSRPAVFFERTDHVVVRGNEVVSRDEYREV